MRAKGIKGSIKHGSGMITDAAKFGFGAALGAGLSTMIFLAIGLAFFIPGIYLLAEERKKDSKDQSQAKMVLAYILMGLGAVIGLGMGANFLFGSLFEDFMS